MNRCHLKVSNFFMLLFWILVALVMAVAMVISEAAHIIVSALKYLCEEVYYNLFPEMKVFRAVLRKSDEDYDRLSA